MARVPQDGDGLRALFITLCALNAFALAMTSCAEPADGETPSAVTSVEVLVEGVSSDLTDWTDPATGCTYLMHRLGGITPRLNAAGRPLCRGGR